MVVRRAASVCSSGINVTPSMWPREGGWRSCRQGPVSSATRAEAGHAIGGRCAKAAAGGGVSTKHGEGPVSESPRSPNAAPPGRRREARPVGDRPAPTRLRSLLHTRCTLRVHQSACPATDRGCIRGLLADVPCALLDGGPAGGRSGTSYPRSGHSAVRSSRPVPTSPSAHVLDNGGPCASRRAGAGMVLTPPTARRHPPRSLSATAPAAVWRVAEAIHRPRARPASDQTEHDADPTAN